MLIATFGPTTGWVGKTITFDNDAFVLQDHGPISANDVMAYHQQRHLVWANDEMRAWVEAKAHPAQVPPPVTTFEAGSPIDEGHDTSLAVAVFNRTTTWSGRTITYNESPNQFMLQDHGPITPQSVLDYDTQGQIDWAQEGLREWVREFADWQRASRPRVEAAGWLPASRPTAGTQSKKNPGIGVAGFVCSLVGFPVPFLGLLGLILSIVGRRRAKREGMLRGLSTAGIVIGIVSLMVPWGAGLLISGFSGAVSGFKGSTTVKSGGSAPALPTPAARKISDPSVTLSPAITRFVHALVGADDHVANSWAAQSYGAILAQYKAAVSGLRRAHATEPKNNGSRQWTLANRCDSCMRELAMYEGLVIRDSVANNPAAESRDTKSFHQWARRKESAMKTYLAYIYSDNNWAGYDAVGRRFTSVTATWTQPQLYPHGAIERRVDIWVGLDGADGRRRCEQTGIGIVQVGTDSAARYWAWYELLPRLPVTIQTASALDGSQDMLVKAGDTVTATVTSLGAQRFRLTVVDTTQGETFSVIRTSRVARCNSAEIIVESHLRHDMGLADFDPVHFTRCAIDGQPISAFHLQKTNIAATGEIVMTSTSTLEADGTGFTVTRR